MCVCVVLGGGVGLVGWGLGGGEGDGREAGLIY